MTAMSANASNMSNGLMARLETNHISSPRFFLYFLFYIILMAIYRYYE